jgi:hypothetical protein
VRDATSILPRSFFALWIQSESCSPFTHFPVRSLALPDDNGGARGDGTGSALDDDEAAPDDKAALDDDEAALDDDEAALDDDEAALDVDEANEAALDDRAAPDTKPALDEKAAPGTLQNVPLGPISMPRISSMQLSPTSSSLSLSASISIASRAIISVKIRMRIEGISAWLYEKGKSKVTPSAMHSIAVDVNIPQSSLLCCMGHLFACP